MKQGLPVAVLLAALLLLAPSAPACGVPCGRIYPILLLSAVDGAPATFPLASGAPLSVELTLTYKFDALNDGYTVAAPNEPVFVTFEFPRKPAWVDMHVEPEKVEVPVNDITRLQPVPDPAAPQAWYSWSTKVTVTVTLTGQAVLRDGYEYGKLLVFAKSSESGLYQSGYGIKEVRVEPEGALHESDVAGSRDVFVASALPDPALDVVEASFGGTTMTVTPPEGAKFWESGTWLVALSPAPSGRAVAALHDEWGNLVAMGEPTEGGALSLNATLAHPGLHTLSVTVLPAPGTASLPLTYTANLRAGDLAAEGFEYAKAYVVQTRGALPRPSANTEDPTMQWERDVPFFAFDTAQSVSVLVTLATPLPADVGRGLANVQFSLLDPDGNLLGMGSVDPSRPQIPMRVGSVPSEGWYTLRLRGVGAPVLATWDARIEVDYVSPPTARDRADAVPDATGALLSRSGRNLTLPLEGFAVWAPSDITPLLDKAEGVAYSVTVTDLEGSLVYVSGLRTGPATFTPTGPGAFRAFVYAEPTTGVPFPPVVRAFTFTVGEGGATTATTFSFEDAPSAPPSLLPTVLAVQAVPIPQPGASAQADAGDATLELVDADGKPVSDPGAPGTYFLRVLAANAGAERTMPVGYTVQFASPVTMQGPSASAAPTQNGLPIPGFAVAGALVALGAVAVAFALLRRR